MRGEIRLLALAFVLSVIGGVFAPSLHAAFPARILVVSAPRVPRTIRDATNAVLAKQGELCDSAEYIAAARDQGLAPSSPDALANVAPGAHARLIVVLTPGRGALRVSLLDGRDATLVDTLLIKTQRGRLSAKSAAEIASAAKGALWRLQNQVSVENPAPVQAESAAPPVVYQTAPAQAPQRMQAPQAAQPREWQQEPEAAPPTAADDFGAEEPVTAEHAAAPTQAAERLVTSVGFGIGVASRNVELPTSVGTRRLTAGPFPAFDLTLRSEAAIGSHGLFGVQIDYQTSVGLKATEQPVDDLVSKRTSLRSHHVDFGVIPGYRFSDTANAVSLDVFLGWAFRGLRPVAEISVPAYSISGPVVRPELRIPIADGVVTLCLAPEVIAIITVSGSLRNAGNVASSGVAWGGEASADIRVLRALHWVLSYRQSSASVASPWGASFSDVERFATLSAVLLF